MKKELLRLNHISLRENQELLLNNLSLDIYEGEILGLVAREDKGADKLIELIRINRSIDFGTVRFGKKTVNRYSYSDYSFNKVYLIQKESRLADSLSIAENIFVLRRGFKKRIIDEGLLESQIGRHMRELGMETDLQTPVSRLSALARCEIELLKAYIMGMRLIIIDNPANFLGHNELLALQRKISELKKRGLSFIYIAYHHREVFRIADRTALFSDGYIKKIFRGREMCDESIEPYVRPYLPSGSGEQIEHEDTILRFQEVFTDRLRGMDFVLNKGECLSLIDLDNVLKKEISALLSGEKKCEKGGILYRHRPYTREEARKELCRKLVLIAEDAGNSMLFPERSYMDNLVFWLDRKLQKSVLSKRVLDSIRSEYRKKAGDLVDLGNIGGLELRERISLVYYRAELLRPDLLVCIQPLEKGDVHCRMHILSLLRGFLRAGSAVLLISTNLSDTPDLSDRIIFAEGGRCVAEYKKEAFHKISGQEGKIP